jgi:hypothetical protein
MPEAIPAHSVRLILEEPLCARCICDSGITLSDIATYIRNTNGSFMVKDDAERCPRCDSAAKVFLLLQRRS